jgi:cyclase
MDHMRTFRPTPEVYAFYDGRVDGYCFSEAPNWVDEGALSLGICSYAIIDGDEALIYDTHSSIEYARVRGLRDPRRRPDCRAASDAC